MELQKWINDQKIPPVQDRKDGKDYWETDNLYTESDVIELLESHPQSKWISVEDELPDKGREVLVWANKVRGEVNYGVDYPSCVKVYFETKESSSVVDRSYYKVVATGITHWQPLPAPPTDKI